MGVQKAGKPPVLEAVLNLEAIPTKELSGSAEASMVGSLYLPEEAIDSRLIFTKDEGMRLPAEPALCGDEGLDRCWTEGDAVDGSNMVNWNLL